MLLNIDGNRLIKFFHACLPEGHGFLTRNEIFYLLSCLFDCQGFVLKKQIGVGVWCLVFGV
jgi:hypothetical protein